MSQTRKRTLELKDAIYTLYSVEGKSLNYISKLFNLTRKTMTDIIKNEFKFEKRQDRAPTKRIQKLINQHKGYILNYCRNSEYRSLTELLKVTRLSRKTLSTLRIIDKDIEFAVKEFTNRESLREKALKSRLEKEAKWSAELTNIQGERWASVKGYEGLYWVSDKARFKNKEQIVKQSFNRTVGRYQVSLRKNNRQKTYQSARIIALAFLPNPNNLKTVNHIDGDPTNNMLENLEWVSQSYQNYHKTYILKRPKPTAYGRNGKFKKVVIDDKYFFKTLKAAAKFLKVSETQIQRYLREETKFDRKIELIFECND